MSALSIPVPEYYGYVLLSCLVGPFITGFITTGPVVAARKKYNIGYPNLYAVPGYHKNADEFNRVQRGQQNPLEVLWFFVPGALVGGLKHPLAVSFFGLLFCLGNYLYQLGYMDTSKDVKVARNLKGGPIRLIGMFGVFGAVVSVAGTLNGWWS